MTMVSGGSGGWVEMQRAGLVSCKCQTEDDGEVRINSCKQTWKLNIVTCLAVREV